MANCVLKFNKKVSGLAVDALIKNENSAIEAKASGAFVRGKYNKIKFKGQEGNQGPYKLVGPNGELYILVVSIASSFDIGGIMEIRLFASIDFPAPGGPIKSIW